MKGWKTILANVLMLAVLVAGKFGLDMGDTSAVEPFVPWVVIIVNLVLRFVTTTPVFKRSID
jgi:hypothetical protein